jgi:DNA polymerase III delta subunit
VSAPLAVFWGDDGYGLEAAVDGVAARLAGPDGAGPGRRRLLGATTSAAEIAELVATSPLFGGGTLVVVADPYPLVRSEESAAALRRTLDQVAPGNGLVFVAALDRVARTPPAYIVALRDGILERGGEARELRAPTEGRFAAWIEARASERGVRLGRGAAQELAARVGGTVREGDVDRRGMGLLAVAELEKLALYRPDAMVSVDDVDALVTEAIPTSGWAFLDAVGERDARRAVALLPGLLETLPEPVVVAQLHRRIRDLAIAHDAAARGSSPPQLMKLLGSGSSFVVQKLVAQSSRWTDMELEDALEGVLDLDDRVKGATPSTEAQRRLAFTLWLVERVGGRARAASPRG